MRDRGGQLLIAKFPRKDDEWPLTRWEATALALAERASIDVPRWRLEVVARKAVLLVERFDRKEGQRIPFMSALTALGADDSEGRSYMEIAEALRQDGAEVVPDLHQLWRRMVFNILVSNTASIENAFSVAPSFGVAKAKEARSIAREVGNAVAAWRSIATKQGLKKAEIDRMESAFEHGDLRTARA